MPSRPRVFVFREVDAAGDSYRELEAAGCAVVVGDGREPRDVLLAEARASDVLVGATYRGGVIDRAILEAATDLRLVAKYTIGVEDVDLEAATELGILVTHAPTEANWGGVAEGTLALMLGLLKQVRERDRAVKAGGWRAPELSGRYVGRRADGYAGLTIGIVGLGRAGRRVAELLAPWKATLLAADPYVDDAVFVRYGVERVDLETLLGRADVVTLHCNLTEETRGLVDAAALAKMKATALLINTARGAVVDLDALAEALESGRVAGAALDVLAEEPPPAGARILALGDRVLLSPHMVAANEGGTLAPAVPWATAAVLDALRGAVPEHVYNKEAVARWQTRFAGRPLL